MAEIPNDQLVVINRSDGKTVIKCSGYGIHCWAYDWPCSVLKRVNGQVAITLAKTGDLLEIFSYVTQTTIQDLPSDELEAFIEQALKQQRGTV